MPTAAFRADQGLIRHIGKIPLTAINTYASVSLEMYAAALNYQMSARYKELCGLFPGAFYQAGKCWSGDPHFFRRGSVIHAFKVSKPDGFVFIKGQINSAEL